MEAQSKPNHRADAGVGFMEVIVGLLIATTVTFVVIRLVQIGYEKVILHTATTGIARELETAREIAKARGQNITVLFNAKAGIYGIDRNGDGKLDINEFEELPDAIKIAEDAAVTFCKTGKLAPKSKEPHIAIRSNRNSHNVTVSNAGLIEIE